MRTIRETSFYTIKYCRSKNRIYACAKGEWQTADIADQFFADQKKALQLTAPNFTYLIDISEMKVIPDFLVAKLLNTQKDVLKHKVVFVAEIIPKSVIATFQMNKISSLSQLPRQIFTAVNEADRWLDAKMWNSTNYLRVYEPEKK